MDKIITKTMCNKKLTDDQINRLNFYYGDAWKSNPDIYLGILERDKTVRHCDYCGREMTQSDVDDYGTLCESCYMEEYYG